MDLVRLPEARIRGLVFDIDGTLYFSGPLRSCVFASLCAAFVLRPGRTRRDLNILRPYRAAQERLRAERVLPNGEDPQAVLVARGLSLPLNEVNDVVRRWMRQAPLPYVRLCRRRGLLRRIRRWRELGVPMAVYSDYPPQDKLRRLGLDFLLDTALCSQDAEARAFKPNPRGFLAAAQRLGLPPEELVYVGDRVDVDLRGAEAAGMGWIMMQKLGRGGTPAGRAATNALDEVDRRLRNGG